MNKSSRSPVVPMLILLAAWALIVLLVNPVGEFMINDDWSFVRILESLSSDGKMIATGWGKGGPSAIVHVLWGWFFTECVGYSLTALRISVLVLGIVASFGLLSLLRASGAPDWAALLGTLGLVANPLFLSQCFTFMTDITFTCLAILSVLCICVGTQRTRVALVVVGLVLAACAILTRQIGIVIPLGLSAACLVHPKGREMGRIKVILLAVGLTFIPMVAYEFFLSSVGSTPVVKHQVIQNILEYPRHYGFPGYPLFLLGRLFFAILGYTCIFVSPVVAVRYANYWSNSAFRYFVIVSAAALIAFEAAILSGLVSPPVTFHRNVIFDFGIGPILLKDTYILGIKRLPGLPASLYYILVYWAGLAMVVSLGLMISFVRRVLFPGSSVSGRPVSFMALFSLTTALAYIGIILLTGFHDRYLILVCALFIVWLISDTPPRLDLLPSLKTLAPAIVPLAVMCIFSVVGVRDFMEMKRSLHKAHKYLVEALKEDRCNVDGGFEFNGYYCYKKDFKPRGDLSWWWVRREDYLVALGPLAGYRTINTFPFKRYAGPNGAVYILQPLGPGSNQ